MNIIKNFMLKNIKLELKNKSLIVFRMMIIILLINHYNKIKFKFFSRKIFINSKLKQIRLKLLEKNK